jgi:hypothetical protein
MSVFPTGVATDSDLYVAVNSALTTLTDNPLSNVATTVNVVSAAIFPSTGTITIDSEIIKYTGKTATSFTGCTRGFDNTTGASHNLASAVYFNVIADHHNVLKEEIKAIESNISTRLGLGSTDVVIASGNVGIGATSPSDLLSITNTGGTATHIRLTGANSQASFLGIASGTAHGQTLYLGANRKTDGTILDSLAASANININASGSDSSIVFYTGATNNAGGIERVRIDKDGKVGIGYTPTYGDLSLYNSGTDTQIRLYHSGTGTTSSDGGLVEFDVNKTLYLWNFENGRVAIGTNNAGRVVVMPDGKVGVLSTSADPKSLLSVISSANTTALNFSADQLSVVHDNTASVGTQVTPGGLAIARDKSSAVSGGDCLGGISWHARYDSEVRAGYGSILAIAEGSSTAAITINTTSSGLNTAETARFTANGRLGIGTTNPADSVHSTGAFRSNVGIYSSSRVITLTTQNTWYSLGVGSNDGLFVYRDGSRGGIAVFTGDSATGVGQIINGIGGFQMQYNGTSGQMEIRCTTANNIVINFVFLRTSGV